MHTEAVQRTHCFSSWKLRGCLWSTYTGNYTRANWINNRQCSGGWTNSNALASNNHHYCTNGILCPLIVMVATATHIFFCNGLLTTTYLHLEQNAIYDGINRPENVQWQRKDIRVVKNVVCISTFLTRTSYSHVRSLRSRFILKLNAGAQAFNFTNILKEHTFVTF